MLIMRAIPKAMVAHRSRWGGLGTPVRLSKADILALKLSAER